MQTINENEEFRFTKHNYDKVFPFSPLKFGTLISKPGAPNRTMKRDNTFNTVKYLYINDIIRIMEKGIKDNHSPNQKHTERWKSFLANDIQEYLNNEHERMQNET